MWLFVPCQYAAESAGLTLASDSPTPEYEPFVTLSGKATQRPLSWHGWRNRSWISLLSGTISQPSQAIGSAADWISSLGESPVSHTLPPAKASESETSATSGAQCVGFFAKRDAQLCSWRTWEPLFPEDSREFSGTWPTSGTLRNGTCSRADNWEPRTNAADCSSWPTPTASRCGFNRSVAPAGRVAKERPSLDTLGRNWATPMVSQRGRKVPEGTSPSGLTPSGKKVTIDLNHQTKNWATPRVHGNSGGGDRQKDGSITPNLASSAKNWATPHANCHTGAGSKGTGSDNLQANASNWPTPKARDQKRLGGARNSPNLADLCHSGLQDNPQKPGHDGRSNTGRHLNTLFVERLMGFPLGWSSPRPIEPTAFDAWETQLAHLLLLWLGECSRNELCEVAMSNQELPLTGGLFG